MSSVWFLAGVICFVAAVQHGGRVSGGDIVVSTYYLAALVCFGFSMVLNALRKGGE